MTQWEREQEDQAQREYLDEWRRTHKRWKVIVYNISPVWEECLVYFRTRYFMRSRTAKIYAAWMRLWYPKVEVEREQ